MFNIPPTLQNRVMKTSDIQTLTGAESPPPMKLEAHTLTHTRIVTDSLGHPVALQHDLPFGHSPNETDKSPTDGS